jgi:hypothetical protein
MIWLKPFVVANDGSLINKKRKRKRKSLERRIPAFFARDQRLTSGNRFSGEDLKLLDAAQSCH